MKKFALLLVCALGCSTALAGVTEKQTAVGHRLGPVIFTNTSVNFSDATVSQATSLTTAVTINAPSGVITTQSATTAAATLAAGFTVNNNAVVSANSVVLAQVTDYAGTYFTNGVPGVVVASIAPGSFVLKIINTHASNALSGTLKIRFVVL